MTNLLVQFLASEHSELGHECSIARAFHLMDRGSALIEHPAFDSPLRLDHIVGQLNYINGRHISDVRSRNLAGWVAEHNDTRDAVVALRRATARGA